MEQKKESKTKHLCAAAKKFPTKGKAFEAFNDKSNTEGVYLVEEIINGQIKQTPYGKCCNSVQDNELCHIHENQRKKEKSGFLYFEKDIKTKCDGVKIKKATANMLYFKTMGDRGRNKTLSVTYHDFKNMDDPIFKIIKMDKNPKLLNELRVYASQLLKSQNIIVKVEDDKEVEKKGAVDNVSKNKELLDTIERLKKEHNKIDEKEKDENDDEIIESDFESDLDSIKSSEVNQLKENSENIKDEIIDDEIINDEIIDDQIDNDSDDDSGIACEEIYTTKGKLLYLEPDSMSVIEPEGEGVNISIGTLSKIEKKYSTIIKDNEYFTVLSQTKLTHEDSEYYRDVLNNRIFNNNFEFKGRVTTKNDSEFKFHFD